MVSAHIITKKIRGQKKVKKWFRHTKSIFIKLHKINCLQKAFYHIL